MALSDCYRGPNAVMKDEMKAGQTSHEGSSRHKAEVPTDHSSKTCLRPGGLRAVGSG